MTSADDDVFFPLHRDDTSAAESTACDDIVQNYSMYPPMSKVVLKKAGLMLKNMTEDWTLAWKLARFLTNNRSNLQRLGLDWADRKDETGEDDMQKIYLHVELKDLNISREQNGEEIASILQLHVVRADMNPILLQVILLLSPEKYTDFISARKESSWYNCVFNTTGDESVPIVFELEFEDDEIRSQFSINYSEHIKEFGQVVAVASPSLNHTEELLRATPLKAPERMKTILCRRRDTNPFTTSNLRIIDDVGIVSTPTKVAGRKMTYKFALSLFSFSISKTLDKQADDKRKFNSLEKFLASKLRTAENELLCPMSKGEVLSNLLAEKELKLCEKGCCILRAIHPDFRRFSRTQYRIFENCHGCCPAGIPGVLAVESGTDIARSGKSIADQIVRRMEDWFYTREALMPADHDLPRARDLLCETVRKAALLQELEELICGALDGLRGSCEPTRNTPRSLLVAFTKAGLILSLCGMSGRSACDDDEQACVIAVHTIKLAELKSLKLFPMHIFWDLHWHEDSVRICGQESCNSPITLKKSMYID